MATSKTTKTKTPKPKAEKEETKAAVAEVEEATVEETKITETKVDLKVKKRKLDPDTEVDVLSNFAGELIYISPKTSEKIVWPTLGETAPMTVDELNTMKNTTRKFFEKGWVKPVGEYANDVITQLRLDGYYKDYVDVSKIQSMFSLSKEEIIEYVKNTKPAIRDTIAIAVQSMIEDERLTNLSVIRAFEEAIGYSLLEN